MPRGSRCWPPTWCRPLERRPPRPFCGSQALPAPEAGEAAAEAHAAPRTPTEELVAAVWADVLGVGPAGANDDFFALGGHSLLAMRAVAALSAHLGRDVPAGLLFANPTVRRLAAAVDRLAAGGVEAGSIPRADPPPAEAPLSFGQERLWFLHRLAPEDASYNIWLTYRLRGPLAPEPLVRVLGAVVDRHESRSRHGSSRLLGQLTGGRAATSRTTSATRAR